MVRCRTTEQTIVTRGHRRGRNQPRTSIQSIVGRTDGVIREHDQSRIGHALRDDLRVLDMTDEIPCPMHDQ